MYEAASGWLHGPWLADSGLGVYEAFSAKECEELLAAAGARARARPARETHRVGPEVASWPGSLTENPYESLNFGSKFEPAL